jgi:hypothetical protein
MEPLQLIGIGVMVIVILFVYDRLFRRSPSPTDENNSQILEGKNRQLRDENFQLQTEIRTARQTIAELKQELAVFEERKEFNELQLGQSIAKLEQSRASLEDEKQRVRREDEERQQQLLNEQNRIWNDHENEVLGTLRELCQRAEIAFRLYENNDLPAEFDGSIKPDAMIEFLGQYLIFDAKKSKDMARYLPDQVQKTAAKLKNMPQIASTVFFVVPQSELVKLKAKSFLEHEYTFFVISPEALEPILLQLKRLSNLQNLSEIDPADRENLVRIIAGYDRHLAFRNAADLWLTEQSIELMQQKEQLGEMWQNDIGVTAQKLRPARLKESEIRRLSQSVAEQRKALSHFSSATPKVNTSEVEAAKSTLSSLQ